MEKKIKTKPCFSKCRSINKKDCLEKNGDICKYLDGPKRKYCKLKSDYYLDKTKDCKITLKNLKFRKKEKTVKQMKDKHKSCYLDVYTSKKKLPSSKTLKKSKLIISNFMLSTNHKRHTIFLKTICSDSGMCIAFGEHNKKINSFFNNFYDFKYASGYANELSSGCNGFIKEIQYNRDGYEAQAILKSSIEEGSDNLMYEYEVGQYINEQNKRFPCFLETYGMFQYKDEKTWKYFKDYYTVSSKRLKESLSFLTDINYKNVGCPYSKHLAILIQHIRNPITLNNFSRDAMTSRYNKFFDQDMLCILYQVYMPLSTLVNNFTHYDLHSGNVLLYSPKENSYVTYNYHLNSGNIVSFKSRFIVKIIDYGRCFYKNTTLRKSSLKTYDNLCKVCVLCGSDAGFKTLEEERYPGSFHHISSQKRNASHDLRLITTIKSPSGTLLNKIQNITHYETKYGTKEKLKLEQGDNVILKNLIIKTELNGSIGVVKHLSEIHDRYVVKVKGEEILIKESNLESKKIMNVLDMHQHLEKTITSSEYQKQNDIYFTRQKQMGIFNIYQDGRGMTFQNTIT
jgi:hypothetical protein